ncbi:MAG: hypothetical protein Q4E06_03805 [Lautropia sp.]|nr:hypothetical protein [Lautropia sp.]
MGTHDDVGCAMMDAGGEDGTHAGCEGDVVRVGAVVMDEADALAPVQVCVAERGDFEAASRLARELAQRHQEAVTVRRTDDVWRVMCSEVLARQEAAGLLAGLAAMMRELDTGETALPEDMRAHPEAAFLDAWDGLGMRDEADEMHELSAVL